MNIIREEFPLLSRVINGKPLVYFDNASTTPKPQTVIDAISIHYSLHSGNPGRSTHTLALESSDVIERTRQELLTFLHGNETYSVIFTKNATESLNLVAHSIGEEYKDVSKKPTIITTEAEHHSNLLPWLRLNQEEGFPLSILPVDNKGLIDTDLVLETIENTPGCILAITHGSNVTGQLVDIKRIIARAKENKMRIILDSSQTIMHTNINLSELGVDYLVASAHKMYGPEGVGFLVIKTDLLKNLSPLLLGGGMVSQVTKNGFTIKPDEAGLEAGTPNTASIAGFSAALTFLTKIGFPNIIQAENALTTHATSELNCIPQISVIHTVSPTDRLPVISFYSEHIHPHDIADYLDGQGIAVRAGVHCAEPLHRALGIMGSVRISLSFYNTEAEINYFIEKLKECLQKFA